MTTRITSQEELTMDEQVAFLSRRVERLERSNRISLALSGLAVAAVVVVGQLPPILADGNGPKSFSAQEFVLVDHSGRTTARLAAAPKGGAALTFYDPKGKRTVAFGFTDDANQAGADLYDGNILAAGSGILRGGIGIGGPNLAGQPNRGPGIGLAIWQPNGHFALSASTGLDGTGQATQIFDSNGNVRTYEGFGTSEQVGLFVSDANGNTRAGVESDQGGNFDGVFTLAANGTLQSLSGGANDDTAAYDILYDGAGTLEALKYVKADGSFSGDDAFDLNGTLRVESYQDPTQTPVQGVQVFDSTGSPVAHLP
jgi:hypothetical protein